MFVCVCLLFCVTVQINPLSALDLRMCISLKGAGHGLLEIKYLICIMFHWKFMGAPGKCVNLIQYVSTGLQAIKCGCCCSSKSLVVVI